MPERKPRPPSKPRPSKPEAFSAHFNRKQDNTILRYGDGDLNNEIGLMRMMLDCTLARMNREGKRLSYRDHLATLRAVTQAAGKVAYLMYTQFKLFSPLVNLKNECTAYANEVHELVDKFGTAVLGEEAMETIYMKAQWGKMTPIQEKNFLEIYRAALNSDKQEKMGDEK